jgi:phosphonopyruvate decarboxylase
LLSYFSATKPVSEHIVTLAAGYYLSTRKVALAANALNPLQPFMQQKSVRRRMLLMIGWRGKPGENDEPQQP